jgi:2-succinyl-6-hydroxy-2,4-cyclohexadiene-1-carboxylate synthase
VIRRLATSVGTVVLSDERPAAGACSHPPLVLLHGFTGSKASWAAIRASFRPTRRVIAIDLPGHGDTVIRDGTFDYSLARTAELIAETLAAMRVPRADLLGYSMGGRVALQLTLAHGERVGRLVLESASAGLATVAARKRRTEADARLATAIERDGITAFVPRWEALPLFRSLALQPAGVQHALRRQRLACRPDGLAASLRGMGLGAQPWLGPRLATLALPVLLVTGEADRKFTRIAERLVSRIPHACRALVAGAGHIPHLEQPERFLRAVRPFLAGATGGRAASMQGE